MGGRGHREYSDQELKGLFHNDHVGAFRGYMSGSRHAVDKQKFLRQWLSLSIDDYVLECGSSSGKTSVDLALNSGCRCLGIDFDEEAIRISNEMRDQYFPYLRARCKFQIGDLTSMQFDSGITKILMPDFTEHIPDRVLIKILRNLRSQFSEVQLFIYTPDRNHVFEALKHRNIVLRNPPGHINVKRRNELCEILESNGWRIEECTWHTSSMLYMKPFELMLGPLPFIGKFFRRRIAIKSVPEVK